MSKTTAEIAAEIVDSVGFWSTIGLRERVESQIREALHTERAELATEQARRINVEGQRDAAEDRAERAEKRAERAEKERNALRVQIANKGGYTVTYAPPQEPPLPTDPTGLRAKMNDTFSTTLENGKLHNWRRPNGGDDGEEWARAVEGHFRTLNAAVEGLAARVGEVERKASPWTINETPAQVVASVAVSVDRENRARKFWYECPAHTQPATAVYDFAAAEVARERKAVVEWLRGRESFEGDQYAKLIEAGEHVKEVGRG